MRVVSVLLVLGCVGCAAGHSMVVVPPVQAPESRPVQGAMVASEPDPEAEVAAMRDSGMLVLRHTLGNVHYIACRKGLTTTMSWPPGEMIVGCPGCTDEGKAPEVQEDTEWTVRLGYSGSGSQRREHLEVTPHAGKLHAVIVVSTTVGLYHIDLRTTDTYTPAVVFWHPPPRRTPPEPPPSLIATTGWLGVGYEVRAPKGKIPRFAPEQAWDDQARTYIRLPASVRREEAPAVYALTPEGKTILVNAAREGSTLFVDRLGEFRLVLDEAYVEVRRTPQYQVVQCPDHGACPAGVRVEGR